MITAFVFPFRLAFLPEIEYWPYVYLDIVTDLVFLANMIITFFMPVFEDSQLFTKKKDIARKYLRGWFIVDFYCLAPLSFFRMLSMKNPRNKDNWENFRTLNFKSLPRFYPMLVIFRMSRMRNVEENLHKVLKKSPLKVQVQSIIIALFWLGFVMHICACFLQAGAYYNLSSAARWTRSTGLIDEDVLTQFIGALYWSTVTTTTVGYGDITQTNPFELLFVFCIMLVGVSALVFYLSELSTLFSEITQSSKAQ